MNAMMENFIFMIIKEGRFLVRCVADDGAAKKERKDSLMKHFLYDLDQ